MLVPVRARTAQQRDVIIVTQQRVAGFASCSAGAHQTCAIAARDGLMLCWGRSYGDPPGGRWSSDGRGFQLRLPGAWAGVSANAHTCAIRKCDGECDGSMQCWGFSANGQAAVPASVGPWSVVSAAAWHTCAIAKLDSSLHCWGNTAMTDGAPESWVEGWVSVSCGSEHSCALRADGAVRCWGDTNYGECNTPADLGPYSSITGGDYHTIAIQGQPFIDTDGDGRRDSIDNCPTIFNPLQADCNSNGSGDVCELAAGAPDFNADTIPDSCQCLADLFVDGQVNGADLGALLAFWGPVNPALPSADINRDGKVDGADLGYLLSNWGPCPN